MTSFAQSFRTLSFRGVRGTVVAGAALALLAGAGCARQVVRVAPEQAIDLSGRWNDVDSRLVAEALIQQSFAPAAGANWAIRHTQQAGGTPPSVIVGTVRNRTMEHVPLNTFVRDLERAYVNTGLVSVVSSGAERAELRDEREDQQQYAAPSTAAALRRETGADYILQGEIQAIEDREGGRSVVFYQVDVTLTDLETNQKIWVGQHEIKKYIDRNRFRL